MKKGKKRARKQVRWKRIKKSKEENRMIHLKRRNIQPDAFVFSSNQMVDLNWGSGWNFISRVIAILSMLSIISCDYTSFHLRNYLNHSVSPCSDFYSHVCPNNVHWNQTVRGKSEKYYKDMAARLKSRRTNNEVLNDIYSARNGGNCTLSLNGYKAKLVRRCGRRINCYR
ncbi:hypothetical protein PMAYCL1PPCAC_19033, partial [Pristionchus mayeri]